MIDDNTIIWFGIHKGKNLRDLPGDYLLTLYFKNIAYGDLKIYIYEKLPVLKCQHAINNKKLAWNKKYYAF